MSALEKIRDHALSLSPAERRLLIHALVDSLPAPDDTGLGAAWEDEIARRIREVEEGKVQCLSHDEVMARAAAACK
ncbi:MAG TPA: addiction module protein [Verrucomicrobiae bacterium]|jgi:putative addiction module component (TIGR02574 family)